MVEAGAVPASHVPEESLGRADLTEVAGAELVEDAELRVYDVDPDAPGPPIVSFLDGIQRWKVTFYDGVVPIVRAYVAGAVRRRSAGRRLRTAGETTRQFHAASLRALRPGGTLLIANLTSFNTASADGGFASASSLANSARLASACSTIASTM